MLKGPRLPDPAEKVAGRPRRARGFRDAAKGALVHAWAVMRMLCGKDLFDLWLPLLAAAGDPRCLTKK